MSERDKHKALYQHMLDSDEIVAECFNDWRRSNIRLKVVMLHRNSLLTEEHMRDFSDETKICLGVLIKNGILKDKTPDGGNVLTTAVLSHLPKHDGPKVIYGTACRIGPERLRRENITLKQLPYKIRVM